MRHLDHKSLTALLLIVTRMIKADSRIDADEIRQLIKLEQRYGFDRSLMQEASHLTLAEAIKQLQTLELPTRQEIFQTMQELASTDKMLERHEALLLLTLRYCLVETSPRCEVVSSRIGHRKGDLGTYILYFESETDAYVQKQITDDWEAQCQLLQQHGLQIFLVEHIVKELCNQDAEIICKMLEYLAPALPQEQIGRLYDKMKNMDTATFAKQILIKDMGLEELRGAKPSLLINLSSMDFLRIELEEAPLSLIRQLLDDYKAIASPTITAVAGDVSEGQFPYYSYFRDFFNLLVQAEPHESRIVLWPNKSEFEFPQIGKKLKLNHQEASLYTTILYYTYFSHGVPTCYSKETKAVEAFYKSVYCRKRIADYNSVVFPDNMMPIRARIEQKIRKQLEGLDNIEDFIPRNVNREGYYRVAAPLSLICVKPDVRLAEVGILDFDWKK